MPPDLDVPQRPPHLPAFAPAPSFDGKEYGVTVVNPTIGEDRGP